MRLFIHAVFVFQSKIEQDALPGEPNNEIVTFETEVAIESKRLHEN